MIFIYLSHGLSHALWKGGLKHLQKKKKKKKKKSIDPCQADMGRKLFAIDLYHEHYFRIQSIGKSVLVRLFPEKTRGIVIALASPLSSSWKKIVIFCNISVITEDIYLKLWVSVHYLKQSILIKGDNQNAFFLSESWHFFRLKTFYPLSSTRQPSLRTRMRCSWFFKGPMICFNDRHIVHIVHIWICSEVHRGFSIVLFLGWIIMQKIIPIKTIPFLNSRRKKKVF